MGMTTFATLLLTTLLAASADPPAQERLYGRVVTAGGRVYEGFLRWDRNEGSWADILNGSKEISWDALRDAERLDPRWERERRDRSIRILGLRISWDDDGDEYPSSASSGIRFGHLRSLAVMGNGRALLTLKSGEELELEGGSTDLGSGFRGLVVEDAERGTVELRWRDLDVVEFLPAPDGAVSLERLLHGTLRTRDGSSFTGYVAWDVDEILGSDILDGEERGRDRKIPFDRIAAIERSGSSGARVVLVGGEEVVLRGSNDVDDDNRGISVSDPALGQVTVSWDAFEEVVFHEPAGGPVDYRSFDGGHPLYGTVETEDGERFRGFLRWDNDEAWSWEILDGRAGDVDLDVEFGQLQRVERLGGWGARVTLLDGRSFEMEGSNDVDDGNKGIYVTLDDGETVLVRWEDFREAAFARP